MDAIGMADPEPIGSGQQEVDGPVSKALGVRCQPLEDEKDHRFVWRVGVGLKQRLEPLRLALRYTRHRSLGAVEQVVLEVPGPVAEMAKRPYRVLAKTAFA